MNISERIAHAILNSNRKPGDIAKATGLSAARISQLATGSGSIRAEHLFSFARATGFSPTWIAEGAGDARSESQLDCALIPQYTAKAAAGNGHLNDHVEVKGSLVFKRDWLQRMGLKEDALRVIYCQGSSMEPTLADGDVLLLDENQTSPANRKVYAILRPDGELIIKRLVRTITSGWIIRSDNTDKIQFPDETASDSEIGHLTIIGRVVWHGGAI